MDSKYFIKNLNLEKHIEGGYFKEIYVCDEQIGNKSISTSIYFLLEHGDASKFHRLKSDELWYYHCGEPLSIYVIDENRQLTIHKLGLNIENGEKPQVLVPKNSIFGSIVETGKGFSLVGCMVSPGFDYKEFKLFSREELLKEYPQYEYAILKLT